VEGSGLEDDFKAMRVSYIALSTISIY
jgi:hypothetical protein